MNKFIKIPIFIIIGVIVLIVIIISTILVIRMIKRNKLYQENKIDTTLGIDREEVIELGGVNQYVYIRGENKNNPVILVLHGGPGSPLTPYIYKYQSGLEKDYTVVNWDQRNSGKTYFLNDPKTVDLSISIMVEDTKQLVEYLRNEFNQEKIIILGHSWGSVLGTAFIQTYPQYVEAYIGVGQLVNTVEALQLGYDEAKTAAVENNNKKDIQALEELKGYLPTSNDFNYDSFFKLRKIISKNLANGYDYQPMEELLFSPYYSLNELSFFLKDSIELQGPLIDYVFEEYHVNDYGAVYQVPVLYILGEHDWLTPNILAKEFFDTIEAPKKDYVLIEEAGHLTMLDQPESFNNAIISFVSSLDESEDN